MGGKQCAGDSFSAVPSLIFKFRYGSHVRRRSHQGDTRGNTQLVHQASPLLILIPKFFPCPCYLAGSRILCPRRFISEPAESRFPFFLNRFLVLPNTRSDPPTCSSIAPAGGGGTSQQPYPGDHPLLAMVLKPLHGRSFLLSSDQVTFSPTSIFVIPQFKPGFSQWAAIMRAMTAPVFM